MISCSAQRPVQHEGLLPREPDRRRRQARAYPETRAFFNKLVQTGSIYRRDWNPATNKRDVEPPYVPHDIPADEKNPVEIFALMNYKRFWDSGMAREMLDEFYRRLPYPPPVLYVDVLTLEGGNFNTGFPTGPLGGSKETQLEGVLAIAKYLRSKGTEVGTEGDRPFLGDLGTYGWLHCQTGISGDDYGKIKGAAKGDRVVTQHVFGNTGCFDVSPIASTPGQIAKVREHYAALLAGTDRTGECRAWTPGTSPIAGTPTTSSTCSRGRRRRPLPRRLDRPDKRFLPHGHPGALSCRQGQRAYAVYNKIGVLHISKFVLTDPTGKETEISSPDCLPPSFPEWAVKGVRQSGT